jgi:hypothetical protein
LNLRHAFLEVASCSFRVEFGVIADDSVIDLEGLAEGHDAVVDDVGDAVVQLKGVRPEMVLPFPLQVLPHVLVELSLQVGLQFVVVWVVLGRDGSLNAFDFSPLE